LKSRYDDEGHSTRGNWSMKLSFLLANRNYARIPFPVNNEGKIGNRRVRGLSYYFSGDILRMSGEYRNNRGLTELHIFVRIFVSVMGVHQLYYGLTEYSKNGGRLEFRLFIPTLPLGLAKEVCIEVASAAKGRVMAMASIRSNA